MEQKKYAEGDEHEILALFEKAFSRKLPIAYWNWRFGNNPFLKPPMINLMWEEKLLAGHYAVSAIEIIVDEKKHLSSLSGTTMTHPDFEGKGIFSKLALTLYERIAAEHGISMVLGFPNKNSHYGLVKKIGWSDVSILSNLAADLVNAGDHPAMEGFKKVEVFNSEHAGYFQNTIKDLGFSVYVNRSETYLNWRYVNCPVNNYDCFEYRINGELAGIMITKKFHPIENGEKVEVDIIEWICAPDLMILRNMLSSVAAFYASTVRDFKVNLWMSLFDPRHLLLERLGFKNGMPLTFMCGKAFISGIDSMADARNWYVAMGDSDVF